VAAVPLIVVTAVLDDIQVAEEVRFLVLPSAYSLVAVRVCEAPDTMLGLGGVTVMDCSAETTTPTLTVSTTWMLSGTAISEKVGVSVTRIVSGIEMVTVDGGGEPPAVLVPEPLKGSVCVKKAPAWVLVRLLRPEVSVKMDIPARGSARGRGVGDRESANRTSQERDREGGTADRAGNLGNHKGCVRRRGNRF